MSESRNPEEHTRPTILVAEDDATFRTRLCRALEERGLEAWPAESVEQAEARIGKESPELALIDLRLGSRSGLELIESVKRLDQATKIVVLTGYGSIATALEAVRLGATHYLTKPVDTDEILAAFDRDRAQEDAPLRPQTEVPSLARVEWEHINRVLTDCGGNVSEAARRLGMHRRSLQRKLAKYPVKR